MNLEINGCGGAGTTIKPPYAIFFEASCNIHDQNYINGTTEKDRLKADLGLVKYMGKDIRRLSLYKRPYYYLWVILYYIAIRLFGKKYFNYVKK